MNVGRRRPILQNWSRWGMWMVRIKLNSEKKSSQHRCLYIYIYIMGISQRKTSCLWENFDIYALDGEHPSCKKRDCLLYLCGSLCNDGSVEAFISCWQKLGWWPYRNQGFNITLARDCSLLKEIEWWEEPGPSIERGKRVPESEF